MKCAASNPNLSIATSLLGVSKTRPKHFSAKQIIERTARHFQIPLEDILGPKRDKDIVVPRQVAMYMLRSELHLVSLKSPENWAAKTTPRPSTRLRKLRKNHAMDASLRTAISEIKERLYA